MKLTSHWLKNHEVHHLFEHFHIQIWQEIGESDLLLQTMRSEDWCYVSSFRSCGWLSCLFFWPAQLATLGRQKSWKQLLWKQRKIAHNRQREESLLMCDLHWLCNHLHSALEAAFQTKRCFLWGCLISSEACLLLKARRYMKSAEAVEHAAKAWNILKHVNFRKRDETWNNIVKTCDNFIVILRSSAFKPESTRPCGRRLATHRWFWNCAATEKTFCFRSFLVYIYI